MPTPKGAYHAGEPCDAKVDDVNLSNAVGLNSASFNLARMIGAFMAVIASLRFLRVAQLHSGNNAVRTPGSLVEGFRYVWKRPDLKAVLLMLFLIGTFALNFPIFISTMAVTVFHAGARQYGLLMSIMAIGSVAGALLSARRPKPRITIGPRWALGIGAVSGFGAALVGIYYLIKYHHLRLRRDAGRFCFRLEQSASDLQCENCI